MKEEPGGPPLLCRPPVPDPDPAKCQERKGEAESHRGERNTQPRRAVTFSLEELKATGKKKRVRK